MQITIDTSKDSPEEIKKVISLLNHFVSGNDEEIKTNFSGLDEKTPPSNEMPINVDNQEGVFNMFGQVESTPKQPSEENKFQNAPVSDGEDDDDFDKDPDIEIIEY